MVTKRFRCRNCGRRFEAQVFEQGESEAKRLPSGPVHCPDCNRTDVEEER